MPVAPLSRARQLELGMNLLTIGSMWEIQEAKIYANNLLVQLKPELSDAHKLNIARQFAIHEWVDAAVRALVLVCGDLHNDDALLLGPITMNVLFQAKTAIELERKRIGHAPPKLPDSERLPYGHCPDHRACEKSVLAHWWNVVGRKVLHPFKPLKLEAISDLIGRTPFPGMNKKCYDDMVTTWGTTIFDEEYIMQAAVKAVKEFHSFLRPS